TTRCAPGNRRQSSASLARPGPQCALAQCRDGAVQRGCTPRWEEGLQWPCICLLMHVIRKPIAAGIRWQSLRRDDDPIDISVSVAEVHFTVDVLSKGQGQRVVDQRHLARFLSRRHVPICKYFCATKIGKDIRAE